MAASASGSSDAVEINYTTIERNETTKRHIEPVGIYYLGSHWYLIAWCRLRSDYRNFRTDKISQLKTTGEKINKAHPPLQSFIDKMSEDREVTKVVMDVDVEVVKYLGEQKYYQGFVEEEKLGDIVRMTFLSTSLMGFSRWFMLFGDHAKIVEPLELNDRIAEIAENILKRLEHSQMMIT